MTGSKFCVCIWAIGALAVLPGVRADDNKDSPKTGAVSAPRETIAKPLSEKEKRKREQKLKKELETPFRKWLDEDVKYIITDEEKATFKRLGTDDERERPVSKLEPEHWLGPPLVETDRPDPEPLQLLKCPRHTGNHGNSDVLHRTRGDFGDRWGHMRAPVARQHDPSHTSALGAAQESTQVLRIGDAIDHDKKRHSPCVSPSAQLLVAGKLGRDLGHTFWRHAVGGGRPGVGRHAVRTSGRARLPGITGPRADQVGQVNLGQGLGEGDHALRRLRALCLLDLALCHKPHRDMVPSGQRLDLPQDRGRIRALHHPDLVHRSLLRGKQFPDRLATFDLVAAERTSDLCRATPTRSFGHLTAAAEWLAKGARASPSRRRPLVAAVGGRPAGRGRARRARGP